MKYDRDDCTFVAEMPEHPALYKLNPPKRAFDMEYSTQTKREYIYLNEHGILPTYVREDEYGIKTYKYKKTAALFKLLVAYYANVEAEKEWAKLERAVAKSEELPKTKESEELIDALVEHGAPIKKVRIYA